MGVLIKNADITLYNKYYDKVDDIDRYQRTVVRGVNWQGKRNATVSDGSLNLDNSILIFVDITTTESKQYISPKQFNKLTDEQRLNYFTFAIGDKVVKGEIDFEITGIRPNSIADLENNFDDVVTVLGVTPWSGHWEVEAK